MMGDRSSKVLSIAAALAIALCLVPVAVDRLGRKSGFGVGHDSSRISTCYLLSHGRWTLFRIAPGEDIIKVVTNGNVGTEYFGDSRFNASYGIRYQILSRENEILSDQPYVFRSRFLTCSGGDAASGNTVGGKMAGIVPSQYYDLREFLPLASRTAYINLSGLQKEPAHLRLAVDWKEPAVAGVSVRVYQQQPTPDYKLRYLWQRTSGEKKRRLARANIYSVDLLTEAERQNLLESRWLPLGARGVEGRDYRPLRLYTLSGDRAGSFTERVAPAGLVVDAEMRGVVPLPEGGGCVRLEIERLSGGSELQGPGEVGLTWFSRGVAGRTDRQVLLAGDRCEILDDFEDGILEIQCHEPLVLRAFLLDGAGETEITPERECVAAFILDSERSVDYVTSGAVGSGEPLRIDVRRFGHPNGIPGPACVRYRLLDAAGATIGEGYLAHSEDYTPYDSLVGILSDSRVTEASRHYLLVGGDSRMVRLSSEDPDVIVTAYTRPGPLDKRVRVPESYLRYEKGMENERDWFLVRPGNYAQCIRGGREAVLRTQKRPSWTSREVAAGDFSLTRLAPVRAERGFRILAPGDPSRLASGTFPDAAFVELPTDGPARLSFAGRPGSPSVSPRVVFFKPTDDVTAIEVLVDGRVHQRQHLAAMSGEFALSPISPGDRWIEVRSPERVALYANWGSASPGTTVMRERTVYRVDGAGLTFVVRKAPRETIRISLQLYRPAEHRGPVRLRAVVGNAQKRPNVPMESWTFPSTLFLFRPPGGYWLPLVGSGGGLVAGGDAFFLTLGPDVPPGEREIRLYVEEGPACFLTATQVVPETAELRSFFRDGDFAEAGGPGA